MAIFFCSACSTGQRGGGPSIVSVWAYTPQSAQVHPLSRFSPEGIVVHVAFTDSDGFQCRAVGSLVITLSETGINNAVETIDLTDSQVNRDRFDAPTRTYLIRFNEVPADLTKVRVSVLFTPDSGTKLRANNIIEK